MTDSPAYTPFPSFSAWRHDVDVSAVDRAAAALEEAKATAGEAELGRAVEIATRYAAVDTGAIEGLYETNRDFTRTIATQATAWQVALQMRGEAVARSIEDALAGYELVLDVVTSQTPLSQSWIRSLHEVLCRSQNTYRVYTAHGPTEHALPKGVYKTMPNSPSSIDTGRVHHYAPVDDTPAEMTRLIDELTGDGFLSAHPVVQAAYAHYAFVCVHPFADGNGRVARALASVFLYRRPGVPLVVFADQKDVYIDALESADTGDPRPFVRFIGERAVDAVELVRLHLGVEAPVRQHSAAVDLAIAMGLTASAAEAESLSADGTESEISAVDAARAGDRLITLAAENLEAALKEMVLPDEVHLRLETVPLRSDFPSAGARPLDAPGIDLALTTGVPRFAGAARSMSAWRVGAAYIALGGAHVPLQVRITDLIPTLAESARLRVAAWAAREAEGIVRDLADALRSD